MERTQGSQGIRSGGEVAPSVADGKGGDMLTAAQERVIDRYPHPVRRARMPSKGLRGGLEVAEGGREVRDTVLWITLVSALGSIGIGALIGAVGMPLLRERAAWQHTALTRY